MNLKRYRVNDIKEAMNLIKRDLGPEAIIVSTRQVREGKFGLFGKTMLEVTAARDDKPKAEPAPAKKAAAPSASASAALTKANSPFTPPPMPGLSQNSASFSNQGGRQSVQTALQPLRQEIQSLREMIHTMENKSSAYKDHSATQIRNEMGEMRNMLHSFVARSSYQQGDLDLPENLMVLYQQLKFSGLEEKFAKRLVMEARKNISENDLENFSYVKIFLARMLMKIIKTTRGIENINTSQKILALIGPTGVGKTTTAAKIASEQMLRYKRRVALITVDTFRIAAVEQLRTYAKIINVPLSIVSNKDELDKAISSYADYEVIVVDTGGCSQRDEMQLFELRELFGVRKGIHNILVLSTTTKDTDMNEITRRFGAIPLDSVIFTKLDESTSYGAIFNHAIRFKKPVAFLTTGQKVPEDIEVASKERLVDLLLNISES